MTANPLLELKQFGQQIWLDNLSRTLLQEGGLQRLIDEDGVAGVTSNPSIFHSAVAASPYYKDDLAALKASDADAEARYESLLIPDVQRACDMLRPLHGASAGDAGYVSLEVSPHLAHDEEGTFRAGLRLKAAVARDNLLVKVPATPEGIAAFERLIAQGVNVNVTLMFSRCHHDAVAHAYLRGAGRWLSGGGDARSLKSVASIFLSRVDTLADKRLEALGTEEALELRGKSAVCMAKLAYRQYREIFHGPEFGDLAKAGVRPQYPLWASTRHQEPRLQRRAVPGSPDRAGNREHRSRCHARRVPRPRQGRGHPGGRRRGRASARFGPGRAGIGPGCHGRGIASGRRRPVRAVLR